MRLRLVAGVASVLAIAFAPDVHAQSVSAGINGQVKAAQERTITAGPAAKPTGTQGGEQKSSSGRPIVRGPKLPPALQKKMQAQLDARVDSDLGKIKSLRGEAIGLLEKFVAETPAGSREMPEALLRLGELKWENEREQFVERFKDWEKKPVDQRGPSPKLDFSTSRALFAKVLNEYSWFPEYDLALYIDGFMATEQGKIDEALSRFERILKELPQSRFVPDAHMAKAEAIFNGKYDYAAALVEYEEVLKYKGSELYGLALFKSAWCMWRLGKNEEAAKRFVSVFEVTDSKGKPMSASQRKQLDELQGEALKYLVEVFTEDEKNTAQDLYAFLQKIGGDRFAGKIVKALAEQYFDQSHYERGIEAYELLLKLEPTSREAGDWILQIAAAYNALEDWAKVRATYERAITGYTAGGPWSRTQADAANVQATSNKIEARLREHATALHAKAQRDKSSRAEYEGAAGLYELYLAHFEKSPQAYAVAFRLAEIEFYHLDRNMQAGVHYMLAARSVPAKGPNHGARDLATLRHDALYNALAALEKVRLTELDPKKKQNTESEADKKFAEALDLYAQLYPTDPALPELFFKQGKLYYDHGVYDSAVKIWGSLLEKFPSSPYSREAGELILDSFNRAKNYENIETWARRLKTAAAFQGKEMQAKLDALIVQSVFKQGEQKAGTGDHAAAAAAYLRAAKEFPKDARAAQACVNAEQEAQKAGDVVTLREAAQLVIGKDYRDKPEAPIGAWIAANTLQAMGLFADAAEFDEAIAQSTDRDHTNFQKFEHAKDAAYNAVVLREAIGEHDRAIVDGQKFLSNYGSTPEADEVTFQMGRAHQNAGRFKDAIALYRQFVTRTKSWDRRAQGYMLLALAELKVGDERGAADSLHNAVQIGKTRKADLGPDGKYAAARARYMEGERILARFDQIQIQGDVKQLKARLQQKTELLKESANTFLDCVSMGVAEWSTAALFQVGRMYESFAKALRDSPPPPNLSAEDKEAYQGQIEPFAVQFEERSLDAYENGWKKAIELGIYNQWTAKMRDALGRLNSELYPPLREIGFELRSQGPAALPALIEAPRRAVSEKGTSSGRRSKPGNAPLQPVAGK